MAVRYVYNSVVMKAEKPMRKSQLVHMLRDRLNFNNLYKQFYLVGHLNKDLQMPLAKFMAWPELPSLKKQQLLNAFKQVSFLKIFTHGQHQWIRLDYQGSNKIVLVTGMHKEATNQWVTQFNQSRGEFSQSRGQFNQINSKRNNQVSGRHWAKAVHYNGFWTSIETNNEATATYLKKYLRGRKRTMDENESKNYKIEKRRIRIVILSQDLFTLLIDAMTEVKSDLFFSSFQLPLGFLPSDKHRPVLNQDLIQELKLKQKSLAVTYYPVNPHQSHGKNEYKQEELSDGFSESNSLNSDLLDMNNKIKDLIQTSDQGIQAANTAEQDINCSEDNSSAQLDVSHSPQETNKNNLKEEVAYMKYKSNEGQKDAQNQKQTADLIQQINQFSIGLNEIQQKPKTQGQIFFRNLQKALTTKNQQKERSIITQPLHKNNIQQLISGQVQSSSSQTVESLYTRIPFGQMRRMFKQFKDTRQHLLVQLPQWVRSQTQEQHNRHLFFQSLCKPKIKNRRSLFT